MSDFMQKEDSFLLNYGYQGCMSAIEALLSRHDVLVYDSECHACMIDGARLHMGKRFVFQHNDMDSFDKQLENAAKLTRETGGGIMVMTEGVFGMAGDQGKLKEIVERKAKYNFRLFVDDAHGFGQMGESGRGTADAPGRAEGRGHLLRHLRQGHGHASVRFVSGPEDIMMYMRYNMRSQTFAKSLPMPVVIGALKRLEMMRTMPELGKKLWDITNALQKRIEERRD